MVISDEIARQTVNSYVVLGILVVQTQPTLYAMIQKLVNRFSHLDSLIRKRATGCPKTLAGRLCITVRAWYKIRDELVHDLGLPLAYDSQRQTYYYKEEGQLVFEFRRTLNTDDLEKLEGGRLLGARAAYAGLQSLYPPLLNW